MDSEDTPFTADAEDTPDDCPEEPWVIPREYEIGGVRWFSHASGEMARALHPLLGQVARETG